MQDILTGKRSGLNLSQKEFSRPEWDDIVVSCENKYWLSSFLEGFGTVTKHQEMWNWTEDGKYFQRQNIKEVTDISPTQFRIVLESNRIYFCYGDILDSGVRYPGHSGINAQMRVVEHGIDAATGCAFAVANLIDPQDTAEGAITAASFTPGDQITLLTNAFGECFEKPQCRFKNPERYDNCFQKISNCTAICDDSASDVLWMKINGERYWVEYDRIHGAQEHRRQVDNAILFSQKGTFTDPDTGYEGRTTQGIVPWLSFFGNIFHSVGSLTESDLQEIMLTLGRQATNKHWHIIMSPSKFFDLQNTFRQDFVSNGAMSFGRFSPGLRQQVGLNIRSYSIGNYMLHFQTYEGFEDEDFLPNNAGGANYRSLGLILNANKGENLKIAYRMRRNGQMLKGWMDEYAGPTMAKNHMPTLTRACKEYQWTSEVGVQFKCLNQHGLIEME